MCAECPEQGNERTNDRAEDPAFAEMMKPWNGEEEPLKTNRPFPYWTSEAPPEPVVAFLSGLIANRQQNEDLIVIETGVGQGYVTRRLGPLIRPEHDLFWCYESDPSWRTQLLIHPFWIDCLAACLKEAYTPDEREMSVAEIVYINSAYPWNLAELYLWKACGKPGSVAVVSFSSHHPPVPGATRSAHGTGDHYLFASSPEADELWTGIFEQSSAPN